MQPLPPDSSPGITLHAWAKVNLCLSVGPPVADPPNRRGWHPIASWMHAINLADRLALRRLGADEPAAFQRVWADGDATDTEVDWPLERDLIARAHRALEAHIGRALPVAARLEKRIPPGGGLGGGSSDAAAMITGINRIFDLRLTSATMRTIGEQLGSDVAFFLDDATSAAGDEDSAAPPRPALVAGFGDRVERCAAAESWLLLIVPPFGCSTPAVYRAYDAKGPRAMEESRVRAAAAANPPDPALLFNDLLGAAAAVEPSLATLHQRVTDLVGVPVHLSGSGSTLFALTGAGREGRANAARSADHVASRLGVRTIVTRLV